MNILLLNPPPRDIGWYRAEHLGLAYLASALRNQGYPVTILDANLENLSIQEMYEKIKKLSLKIDLIGITATESESLTSGIEVIKKLKHDGLAAHVTAGGYFPSFWCDEIFNQFSEIDSIVIGEGEETIVELADALNSTKNFDKVSGLVFRNKSGQVIHNQPRKLIKNLDKIPFPSRDYCSTSYQKYHHAVVYSSRGCYHQCSFCQIAKFYRFTRETPFRTRSAANIVDEIEILISDFGIRSIFFVDDEFITESPKRRQVLDDLVHEINRRNLIFSFSIQYRANTGQDKELLQNLKNVGLTTVFVGVESGVEKELDHFEKDIDISCIKNSLQIIDDLELNNNIGYILYNPSTTFDDLKQSIEFLLAPDSPSVLKLNGLELLKGTQEEAYTRQHELIKTNGFHLSYRILDKRVAKFAELRRHYYPIYEPVARDFYELHFLMGDLSKDDMISYKRKIKTIEIEIRKLHKVFLQHALDDLYIEKGKGGGWLVDLKDAFILLHNKSQQLLAEGQKMIKTNYL